MTEFGEEKIKECKEAFQIFDRDNDGLLNIEETSNAFLALGYEFKKKEMCSIFSDYATGDRINFKSFLAFLSKRSNDQENEEELMECFQNFDRDGDGKLNAKELKYTLLTLGEKLSDDEIDEIINEIDSTGEGSITYQDFVKLMLLK